MGTDMRSCILIGLLAGALLVSGCSKQSSLYRKNLGDLDEALPAGSYQSSMVADQEAWHVWFAIIAPTGFPGIVGERWSKELKLEIVSRDGSILYTCGGLDTEPRDDMSTESHGVYDIPCPYEKLDDVANAMKGAGECALRLTYPAVAEKTGRVELVAFEWRKESWLGAFPRENETYLRTSPE